MEDEAFNTMSTTDEDDDYTKKSPVLNAQVGIPSTDDNVESTKKPSGLKVRVDPRLEAKDAPKKNSNAAPTIVETVTYE